MGWSERGEIRDSFKLKIEITSPTIFCRENVKLCKSQILCISKLFIACSFFCSILSSYWGGQFGQNNNKMQPSHENYLLSVCLLSSLVSFLSAFVISVFIDGYPLFALFAIFLKNGPTPASFWFIFRLFKQTLIQFLQQINAKNVHPVYDTGIRTHNLLTWVVTHNP